MYFLFRVLPNFHECLYNSIKKNKKYMFSISFRKHHDEKKKKKKLVNRPRSIYQYSNMAPRLSGQTSIFGVVI